jgi:hypothetical protein
VSQLPAVASLAFMDDLSVLLYSSAGTLGAASEPAEKSWDAETVKAGVEEELPVKAGVEPGAKTAGDALGVQWTWTPNHPK